MLLMNWLRLLLRARFVLGVVRIAKPHFVFILETGLAREIRHRASLVHAVLRCLYLQLLFQNGLVLGLAQFCKAFIPCIFRLLLL